MTTLGALVILRAVFWFFFLTLYLYGFNSNLILENLMPHLIFKFPYVLAFIILLQFVFLEL